MNKNITDSTINTGHNWIINFAFGFFSLKKTFKNQNIGMNYRFSASLSTPKLQGLSK